MGKNSLKFLDAEACYLLYELKIMHSSCLLYVIVDQKADKYYIADWEHNKNQGKIIGSLKSRLAIAIKTGLERVFT
jgi:hypothetical protein